MQRSNQLKALRPLIPTIMETGSITPQEQFQNQVLRPILKLQHELLIAVFKSYVHKRKGVFYDLSTLKKQSYIQQALQRDRSFRNLLIGSIVGQFTLEEYAQYMEEEQQLGKRMMNMCVQRIQSHYCQEVK